jgi:hypothetical protein
MKCKFATHPSTAQLSLLERNLADARAGNQASAVITGTRRRADLPENQLERQIRDFLAYRGFVSMRLHVGTFAPWRVLRAVAAGQMSLAEASRQIVTVNEKGTADWLSIRPLIPPGGRASAGPHFASLVFWEAKSRGQEPTAAQLEWLHRRQQVGQEATWFDRFEDEDQPSPPCDPKDSHTFLTWFSWFGRFYEL